jgi:hypothetical protein
MDADQRHTATVYRNFYTIALKRKFKLEEEIQQLRSKMSISTMTAMTIDSEEYIRKISEIGALHGEMMVMEAKINALFHAPRMIDFDQIIKDVAS